MKLAERICTHDGDCHYKNSDGTCGMKGTMCPELEIKRGDSRPGTKKTNKNGKFEPEENVMKKI